MIDALIWRILTWQIPPLASSTQSVQDCVHQISLGDNRLSPAIGGAQFLKAGFKNPPFVNVTDVDLTCHNLDPKNRTFFRYAGLDVDLIDVQSDGDIDKMEFDIFVNRVLSADGDGQIIVDVDGNIHISLIDYFRNNEVLQLFLAEKVEVLLHIPIVGAGDLFPTLKTLDELMHSTQEEVQAAVWINQKKGKAEYMGKSFAESERYGEHKSRIHAVTRIPLWRPDIENELGNGFGDAQARTVLTEVDCQDAGSRTVGLPANTRVKFIPAYAGNARCSDGWPALSLIHPRVCGEFSFLRRLSDSSPCRGEGDGSDGEQTLPHGFSVPDAV